MSKLIETLICCLSSPIGEILSLGHWCGWILEDRDMDVTDWTDSRLDWTQAEWILYPFMDLFTCDIYSVAYQNANWMVDYVCVTCTLWCM